MRRWSVFCLLSICLISASIRLLPLLQFQVWGSDTGEYLYLTRGLVNTGALVTDYQGWGAAYPDFPGMFIQTGALHLIAGTDILLTLAWFIPLLSSLFVLPLFFIARDITGSDRAALIGCAFAAMAFPHVYHTSHPMPGSLGDLFLIFSILLFLKSRDQPKLLMLLAPLSMALVITHHLSSYFLFIALMGGVGFRSLLSPIRSDGERDRRELAYLAFLALTISVYWTLYSSSFSRVLMVSPLALIAAPPAAVGGLALVQFVRSKLSWVHRPGLTNFRVQISKLFLLAVIVVMIPIISIFQSVPGTSIRISPENALIFIPLLLLLALCSVGPALMKHHPHGYFLLGWISALMLSMVVGLLYLPHFLLPYRHSQYLLAPAAILVGAGAVLILDSLPVVEKDARRRTGRMVVALVLVVLLAAMPLSAYPPKNLLGGFQEGTMTQELESASWFRGDGVVVTDHRLSSMSFGLSGAMASWDTAGSVLFANTTEESLTAMAGVDTPTGERAVSYVLVCKNLKTGVALAQWENAEPLEGEAWDKFFQPPYVPIFSNGQCHVLGVISD